MNQMACASAVRFRIHAWTFVPQLSEARSTLSHVRSLTCYAIYETLHDQKLRKSHIAGSK